MRAILADADPLARARARRELDAHPSGIVTVEASSLTEILRALVEHHPVRLVVMDLGIGGMNGFQGLQAIRRLFPDVRCLLLSNGEDAETAAEAMRLGAHGFLSKRAAETRLAEALTRVLAGELYRPAPPAELPRLMSMGAVLAATLTPRERDIVLLLREGLPNKAIANRLAVSEVTVKSHLGKVFRKLGVRNRLQALRLVVEAGPI